MLELDEIKFQKFPPLSNNIYIYIKRRRRKKNKRNTEAMTGRISSLVENERERGSNRPTRSLSSATIGGGGGQHKKKMDPIDPTKSANQFLPRYSV